MKNTKTAILFIRFIHVLAGIIATVLFTANAHASLIWYGDPSQGTGVFKHIDIEDSGGTYQDNPSPNGSSVTTFKDSTYGASWQFYKAVNDKRCEAHGAAGFNPAVGNTYYIGWRFKINDSVTDNAIFQWKAYGSPMYQNYPITFSCNNGNVQLFYSGSNEVGQVVWNSGSALGLNAWHTCVIEITVSSAWNGGSISFWFDGTQVVNGFKGRTFDGTSVDPKWGIYGATSSQVADDINSLKIGTTYSDVAPGSGGSFSGNYQLQNEASGMALNVSGGSTANGAEVVQWPYDGKNNSKWSFTATDSGYYQIVNVNSGKDAVVQGASTSKGALIVQWSFGSSQNDQWLPQQNSDGSYTFINRKSGLVLEDPGNSTTQGTQMDQWSSNGGANQKWKLISE